MVWSAGALASLVGAIAIGACAKTTSEEWGGGGVISGAPMGPAAGTSTPGSTDVDDAGGGKSSASAGASGAPTVAGITPASQFDLMASQTAFQTTAYPLLTKNCGRCHSEGGTNQRPLIASSDVSIAHMATLLKVDLRETATSKLVERLGLENHNCWGDCTQNAQALSQSLQDWAKAVSPLPVATVPAPQGKVTDAQVGAWIAADRKSLSAQFATYAQYTSLHTLFNAGATLDQLNTARVGISKALNSTARYAPKIVNPVAIDPYGLVYRFDVRDYWGYWPATAYATGAGPGPANASHALTAWTRVKQGNINGDFSDGKPSTYPNIAGFHSDYVEASQLVYTVTRPDVYNELMNIPPVSAPLETQLAVDTSKGIDSFQYMTVDNAITLNKRMLMRAPISTGYFWKSTDPFAGTTFVWYERPVPELDQSGGPDMLKTTPLSIGGTGLGGYSFSGQITLNDAGALEDGLQTEASEIIWSLPNGLQGYMIGGAGDEQRVDAFTFVVVDPRRGGAKQNDTYNARPTAGPSGNWRLLEGASCQGCHDDGLNRAPDGMLPYLAANPTKFDSATVDRVKTLYPGTVNMGASIEGDRAQFASAVAKIEKAMILGLAGGALQGHPTADQTAAVEPVMYMFEKARTTYMYANTQSN
jgi:cytochrome c553